MVRASAAVASLHHTVDTADRGGRGLTLRRRVGHVPRVKPGSMCNIAGAFKNKKINK